MILHRRAAFIFAIAFSLATVGCHSVDRKVDQLVAKETPASHGDDLTRRGFETWASSAELDLDQKSKLWTIHAATAHDAVRIRGEITKTKSALFKELAKANFDQKLIDGFKSKIVKLDQERLDLMFKALDSVEAALGRGRESRQYYRYLEEIETRGFDGR